MTAHIKGKSKFDIVRLRLGIIFIISTVSIIFLAIPLSLVDAQLTTLNITKSTLDTPYGGEKIGSIFITPEGHLVHISGKIHKILTPRTM